MNAFLNFDTIVRVVCEYVGTPQWPIFDNTRHRRTVAARQLIVVLARQFTIMSGPEIAIAMKRRNHSTVFTQIKRWSRRVEKADRDTREWIDTRRGDVHPREALAQLTGVLKERQAA